MKNIRKSAMILLAATLLAGNALALTLTPFESGSSCGSAPVDSNPCSGAYTPPSTNSTIQIPENGILDYTTFTIPTGYTVKFIKNAANTPVTIRTSGNVTITGIVDVSAETAATHSGTAGDGNLGDDGQPGIGGPGGFDGGQGGLSPLFGGATWQQGGSGKGPGGGGAGGHYDNAEGVSGGGGGFGGPGASINNANWNGVGGGVGGAAYGQASLLPLIGGSGGGGGAAGSSFNGGGGGGGGGAIAIFSSGTILFNGGQIIARGSAGGTSYGTNRGGGGGGGSGGGIRLVAETLTWAGGNCYANGGTRGEGQWANGYGASGRIRFEANTISGWYSYYTSPEYTYGLPGHVFVPNGPTLTIVSVTANASTLTVPANPSGNADITFPTGTTTATVHLAATGIPEGSTADVHVIPSSSVSRSQVLSAAFGVPDGAGVLTSTATVTLSPGNNVLQAAVTYTITEAIAMTLPQFDGEFIAKIRVEGGMNGASTVTYITASGKEYPAYKG